jgi:hypothetical protein
MSYVVGLWYRPGVASATGIWGGDGETGDTPTAEPQERCWPWRRRENEKKEGGLDGIRIYDVEQQRIQSSNTACGRRGNQQETG